MTEFIGSVVSNTMKPRDVLAGFINFAEAHYPEPKMLADAKRALASNDDDDVALGLDELLDKLNELLPAYLYAGGHQFDPADHGIWIDWDAIDGAKDVLRVENLEEVPADYVGYVLTMDNGMLVFYEYDFHTRHMLWQV